MEIALTVLGWLLIAIGIGVSIALHELGHLVPAKRFGVKCTQYMIGFGPTLWSRRKGETEYGVKAVPLGGYVRMIGMIPPRPGDAPGMLRDSSTSRVGQMIDQARHESMVEVKPGDEDRVFYKLPVLKKIIVMLGGPLMNLVLAAFLLFVLLCGIGQQTLVPTVSALGQCVPTGAITTQDPFPACQPGDPAPPSAAAGMRPGDRIVEVNGQPVTLWSEVTRIVRDSAGRQVTLVVERGEQRVTLTPTITAITRGVLTDDGRAVKRNPDGSVMTERVGYLGASASVGYIRQPVSAVPSVLGDMLGRTAGVIVTIPEKMVGIVKTITGQQERDAEGPISVVGVARAGGELFADPRLELTAKLASVVALLFGVNLALFLFNLIPLMPLDGGQIAGAVWEGIKRGGAKLLGRPDPGYVDVAKGLPIAYAVSMVFIVMTLVLVYADIFTPIKLN